MKQIQDWWDDKPLQEKKNLVSKYLSPNRTVAFLTNKDLTVMYDGEKLEEAGEKEM